MVLSIWSETEYFPRYCGYNLIASQSHSDMVHRQWYLPSNCNPGTVGNTLFLIRWTVPSGWQWNPDSRHIKHHVYIVYASHRTAEQSDWSCLIGDSHAFFFAAGPPNAISCEIPWELWPDTINLTAFLAVACTHMVWVLPYMTRTGFYRPIQWCYLFHSILAISHGVSSILKKWRQITHSQVRIQVRQSI